MAQFHPFDYLPKELRDSIWDMAIRNDEPAAHFFTMYDVRNDPGSLIDPNKTIHITRNPRMPNHEAGLAAPRGPRDGRLSWTDGNNSTYLTDSGLWTACHESRKRMLQHFKPSETSPLASRQMQLDFTAIWNIMDRPTASVNMEFTRDNGERQYLTIHPSKDLICLQRLDNFNISFATHDCDWQGVGDFPLFRWRSDDGHGCTSHFKHVAIEYDPAWEDSARGFYDRLNRMSVALILAGGFFGLNTFYFIDYRLSRKFKRENEAVWQPIYHAGRLTFIGVSHMDQEWCCCPRAGCSDECLSNKLLIRPTVHGAHDLADSTKSYRRMLDAGPDEAYKSEFFGIFAVLACVDLELEGELPTRREFFDGINKERLERLRLGLQGLEMWPEGFEGMG